MATEAKKTDLKAPLRGLSEVEQFEYFLKKIVGERKKASTPEKCVKAFRRWLEQLDELQEGIDEADAGLCRPYDHDDVMRRMRERWAGRGIAD